MIEAVYACNEYLKTAIEDADLVCGEMYPGAFAPSIEDGSKFVTYTVVENDTYDLAGLKEDYVTYRFYNPDFDQLSKVMQIAKDTFNVYDIEETSLSEPGVSFQETFFRVINTSEASFAEGVDYYVKVCELKLQYTVSEIEII
jgi:hypothetical protein